jgi:hypothetical protein
VTAAGEPRSGEPIDWLLVVLISLLTGWSAVVALAFLPLHIGWLPLPISALLGVVAMIMAPRACFGLTGSLLAAALPVVTWFGVSILLVMSRNRVIQLPYTVVDGQWRVMVLLGLGSLTAAATIGLLWGDRVRQQIAVEAAADPPAG